MAEQFYTILTKIGKAKIANTSALGSKLNLARFQVGDSNGSYYNPTEEQTELKHKVWEGPISSITIDENNPNWIVLQTMLPGDIGGFMIREAGVFDEEGNLIAVGKYPETYKPVTSEGSSKDLVIKMILEVSNASSVTLKIDPTVILATKKDIEILENKIKNIKVPVTKVNEKIGNVVLTAEDIKCKNGTSVETSLDDKIPKVFKYDESPGAPLEISQWIDFHNSGSKTDYDARIYWNSSTKYFYEAIPNKGEFKLLDQRDYDQLFQFVSNGKSIVTSATTDMGVPTASDATFDTIASNIRKIYTGKKFARGLLYTNVRINTGWTTVINSLSFTPSIVIMNNIYSNKVGYILYYPNKNIKALELSLKINFDNGGYSSGRLFKDIKIENNSISLNNDISANGGYIDSESSIDWIAIE